MVEESIYDLDTKIFKTITPKFVAGGLYNPMIATLITGLARTKLHEIEEKYKALYSSTDSIKTTKKVKKKDLGNKLGKLDYKFKNETVHFFRNKLYYTEDSGDYAMHGFQGTIQDLKDMEGLHPNAARRYGPTICRLVEQVRADGLELDPIVRLSHRQNTTLAKMRSRTAEIARDLDLEPAVLATRRELEQLVRSYPDTDIPDRLGGWRSGVVTEELVNIMRESGL